MTTASRRVCGHGRISCGMGSPQGQPLQAPAFGDGQRRQMDIGVEPGWQLNATQQLVKYLPGSPVSS